MAAALQSATQEQMASLRYVGRSTTDIIAKLVQMADSKGLTPLHQACIKGHAAAADVLTKLGANPFATVRTPSAPG